MDEFRDHPYWCPLGHPEGVRRFDVFTDYGAFPVWGKAAVPAADGRSVRSAYGMAGPECLGIAPQLAEDLQTWANWQDQHSEYGGGQPTGSEARTSQQAQGQELADRLARETGAVVVFGKSRCGGGPPDCPHCGAGRRS